MVNRNSQLAYVAGLFEGEGNFNSFIRKKKDGTKYSSVSIQASIAIHERDKDVLIKVRDILGYGKIYGPYNNMFHLRFTGPNEVASLAVDIWEWLGGRRKSQYEKAIKLWREYKEKYNLKNDELTIEECSLQ